MIDTASIVNGVIATLIGGAILTFFSRNSLKEWLKQTKWAKLKMFGGLLAWAVSMAFILTLISVILAFVFYGTDFEKWDLVIAAMNIGISRSVLLTACLTILCSAFGKLDNNFIENIKTWSATFMAFAVLFAYIQITHDYRKYVVLPNYQEVPCSSDIHGNEVIKPDR